MTLDEFFLRLAAENAASPGSHTLHPGLTDHELAEWHAANPQFRLPIELLTLLRHSNGLGVYQDYYDGEPIYHEGAYRFLPLAEIGRADLTMWNVEDDDPRMPATRMAFVHGPDSDVFYGFDCETLHFWQLEPMVPEASEDLGPHIGPVLERVIRGVVS